MMISMKAHWYDNTFLIILHPPRGWGLSICALNWSVSQRTWLTLQIEDIYQKVHLQSPPAHIDTHKTLTNKNRHNRGHIRNKHIQLHTKRHKCICIDTCITRTDTGINKVILHAQEMSQVCTWDRGPWHFIPIFGILDYPDKDEMEKRYRVSKQHISMV